MTGQVIKIVREIPTAATAAPLQAPEAQVQQAAAPAAPLPQPLAAVQSAQFAAPAPAPMPAPAPKKQKPRKFTVGDVQFKYDGEKMY